MKSVAERLRSYEPLWENWTYTGEFLGEGAMSSVFEIQSTAMGLKEIAALKIITVKKGPDGEVRIPENTLNEIKILRALSGCPNIVRYHDSTQRKIFDENNNLSEIDILIKMEKLEPLTEGKKLSEEEVMKLACDMCKALVHASEAGIIHRDIKPQNIFVSKDGTYKLGDFGIAKIISDLSHHYTMNIGTLAYTAPEVQGSKAGSYDISSDIYSLGLVLYVFLNNGYLPFTDSASVYDAIMKRLSGAPFPSPANGSAKLKAIVMRACSNDTIKRYRTPKEMLDDLELLSSGGKKFVPDPFATLDANIDEVISKESGAPKPDTPVSSSVSGHSKETPVSKSRGLKIHMSKSSDSEGKASSSVSEGKITGGGLKINVGGTVYAPADTASESKTRVAAPGTTPIKTKGGLKINMKSSTDDAPGIGSESKTRVAAPDTTPVKTKGGLKINMKSSTDDAPSIGSESKTRVAAPDTTSPEVKDGLKTITISESDDLKPIGAGLDTHATSDTITQPDTKAETKGSEDDAFFFTPSSL